MKRVLHAVMALGLFVGLAVGAGPTRAAEPSGPSFACGAADATVVEREICAVPAMAAADREMADLFAISRTSAFGTGSSNQLFYQRAVLKDMRACAGPNRNTTLRDCLAAVYRQRVAELAVASLMQAPAKALPPLRRIDPAFAPVAEAVAIWAGQPIDANWSAPQRAEAKGRIIALLTPYVSGLLTSEDQSFGRSILTAPGIDGVAVKRIDDLFVSDRHFAAFLNVLGPYIPDEGRQTSGRRSLPCAAVVRHPALLNASASVFGSTMDSFVLDTDCEQTLPPTPALGRLTDKLNAEWPQCDGTIRFAAYRSFQSAIDAARLGRPQTTGKPSFPARRGVTAADVAAARAELKNYYRANLGKSEAEATAMAGEALSAILSNAQECD